MADLFAGYPTHDAYRPMRLKEPMLRGPDVYALQTALLAHGSDPGPVDGVLGARTAVAIKNTQRRLTIADDGIAGPVTQRALVRVLADEASAQYDLPAGLLFGQLSHESGCLVGNYSPRRSDGTYDAGVAQRNTAHTPARDGFTVDRSIDALGDRLRGYYNKFAGVGGRRQWKLAAGAWNAPAFACWIARERGAKGVRASETARPSDRARSTLEAYMASATKEMQ